MTPRNGHRAPGLGKALAGMMFLLAAAGIATLMISSAWDIRAEHPRVVVEAR